jgi:hypothetical protein
MLEKQVPKPGGGRGFILINVGAMIYLNSSNISAYEHDFTL